jgi:hypothetical protein
MSPTPTVGVEGNKNTIPTNAIHVTEITATGRLW